MYKIGKACFTVPNREVFEKFVSAGIGAIELSVAKPIYPNIDFASLQALALEYGVEVWSMHLPWYAEEEYGNIDVSSTDADIRRRTLEYYLPVMEKAAEFGINKFVVHPSREPITAEERPERIKCAQDTLDKMARKAKQLGAVIAVEDLPRTCLGNCSDEILKLISVNDDLRVCFDTNHLLFEDNAQFIRKVGEKIVTLHVSDYDFVNERHWLPGEGKVDWQSVITALREISYNGVWLYELGLKTPDSIQRPRDLTLDDLVRNAKEIFENNPITVLSLD